MKEKVFVVIPINGVEARMADDMLSDAHIPHVKTYQAYAPNWGDMEQDIKDELEIYKNDGYMIISAGIAPGEPDAETRAIMPESDRDMIQQKEEGSVVKRSFLMQLADRLGIDPGRQEKLAAVYAICGTEDLERFATPAEEKRFRQMELFEKDSVWHYNRLSEIPRLKETIMDLEAQQEQDPIWFSLSNHQEVCRLTDAVCHLPQGSDQHDMEVNRIYSSMELRESSAGKDVTLSLSCEDERGNLHQAVIFRNPVDRPVSEETELLIMHAARFPEAEIPEREYRRSDNDFIPNETVTRIRNPYREIVKDIDDRNHFKQAIEAYMRDCKSGLHKYPHHKIGGLELAPSIAAWESLEHKRNDFSLDDWMRSESKEGASESHRTEKSEHTHSLPDNVIS